MSIDKIEFTVDGKRMVSGSMIFELKATHGLPLDFTLDRLINDEGFAIDWTTFVETARQNDWWDFKTYGAIGHAMEDAGIPKEMQDAIKMRLQRYMLMHPHPKMSEAL